MSFKQIADLTGRVALVTGGGTGIGLKIARGLAANGAKVYISGRRTDVLDKVSVEQAQQGLTLIPLPMDVTNKTTIKDAVKTIKNEDGKLHILVNNAGGKGPISSFIVDQSAPERVDNETFGSALLDDQSFEGWKDVFALNVAAPFFVTSAFLGLLEAGARDLGTGETSSVINISSAMAYIKLSWNRLAYAATKAALSHLTQSMSTEFARQGIPIRVNAIAPGYFQSEMTGPAEELLVKSETAPIGILSPFPVKRAGREEELTLTVLALAAGGFIMGQVIVLDGGLSAVNP
ncbi:hypothetical protein JAAARDRAFT_191803 [Jaapia argillacea MUCL 33604]|uniref:NAD(P)-binding protein n=1 Tax=Jaapia argillacea MUCL 33604 TaxID=933084 RepID=A0A067Q0G5_9AGAM|nr:hypothetical protein JAAARDRAFT_191803 [Jaapia argillacea MUCL 33604]